MTPGPAPPDRPLRVLQVNTLDVRGGAARIAMELHRAYRRRGLDAWMAVRRRDSGDPRVLEIPNEEAAPAPTRLLLALAERLATAGPVARRAARGLRWVAEPRRQWDLFRGVEDFHWPATRRIPELPPAPPDVLHAHNLHGRYFDLRALPELSRRRPVVLTLHDAWLLSGHCAHSFDCDRWLTGCGRCPDLTIPPAVRRDATARNWRRKREIYRRARLRVATPCRWLADRVERSMLGPEARETRVIPNGVDLSVFRPGERRAARAALQVPEDAAVLLFTADSLRRNRWKDFDTVREAAGSLAARLPERRVLLLALGEAASEARVGEASIRFVPFTEDRERVAAHYRAADLYLHAARADTFPNTVLEALACATPVVATRVGGIPEQVRSLAGTPEEIAAAGPGAAADATGALVEPGRPGPLVALLAALLRNEPLRRALGETAARDAAARFDIQRQVEAYLSWYGEMIEEDAGDEGA